ncbi:MAG: hypothetical protein LBE92_15590 [Chryseobacterium sp.]|jgi:hypothetical protein|uniref:hypothetical protein n=1 Tax=Chryseobacterium sp. TaxID=1871047 RepID=UPI002819667F|nr:hypothetical protein [Chryseobacterium sp.]MDR2237543.1 hypothetical protein [Chryseobacterium sp.]
MKHYLLLFFFVLLSCKKENPELNTASDNKMINLRYEVLNDLLLNKDSQFAGPETCCIYQISPEEAFFHTENEEPDWPMGINTVYSPDFPAEDSVFFKNENKDLINFKLNKDKIGRSLFFVSQEELDQIKKPDADFWTEFSKKYPNKCIRRFSVPFFNKDRSKCIVRLSVSCGPLDGSGYMAVYQKINGRWKEVRILNEWIS